MRVLVLTPFLPHPQAHGGTAQAVFDRICLLVPKHEVAVAAFAERGDLQALPQLREQGIEVDWVPRHHSRARSQAQLAHKRLRLVLGFLFGELPLLAIEFRAAKMQRLVAQLLREGSFDVVLVEHTLMAQYMHPLSRTSYAGEERSCAIVVTEHDIDAAFRTGEDKGWPRTWLDALDRRKWRRYLERSWRIADAVLVPTPEDAQRLKRLYPEVEPEVAAFGARVEGCKSAAPRDDERTPYTMVFVGNFDHPPNVEAALRLAGRIMPLLKRSCPEARLVLVGKNPPAEVLALKASDVLVTGEVPSVQPYLREATIFVAPIESGGGTRIKLIEAMASGMAVVTTPLGARGLGATADEHLLVAEEDDAFAAAAHRAMTDPALRARLGRAARDLVCSEERAQERALPLNAVLSRAVAKHQARAQGRRQEGPERQPRTP
jgi:polysaccharide biosynthesis protein PslH